MKRSLLGEIGLRALAAGPPTKLTPPTVHITGTTCRRSDIDRAIDTLRRANVAPNADGSYNMKTVAGWTIRVTHS